MKAVWTTAALLVIVGSLVFLAVHYRSQPEPGEPVPHRMPVACAACGKAYIATVGRQPAECHYCGELALWRATQCAQCGAIFPIVGGSSFEGESESGCPECGGHRFKRVSPDGLEEP